MDRKFRILLIDDEVFELMTDDPNSSITTVINASYENYYSTIKSSAQKINDGESSLEITITNSTSSQSEAIVISSDIIKKKKNQNRDQIFKTVDILILDIGDIKIDEIEDLLTKADLPNLETKKIETINDKYPGVSFYLKQREKLLQYCQAVIIITKHDDETMVTNCLDKYCSDNLHKISPDPWTIRFSKNRTNLEKVDQLIISLYEDFSQQYTLLSDRGQIEFAASHDLPVLIVGESGIGKEYIAKAIHRRWRQEKVRKYPDLEDFLPSEPAIVNCAGLTAELARRELFGNVKGAYTGANKPYQGQILTACGLKCGTVQRRKKQKIDNYLNELKSLLDSYKQIQSNKNDSNDDVELVKFIRNQVIPFWEKEIKGYAGDSHFNLKEFFNFIHKSINQGEAITEFEESLVKDRPDLIGRNDQTAGLIILKDFHLGTLFLDEFAELPVEVQTLLLRFLQNNEIQPLGYPKHIQNVKLRIIVATSDSRVAKFAERKLFGSWRSKREIERPIRQDLIYRVMYQIIRPDPVGGSGEFVDKDNIRKCLDNFISNRKKEFRNIKWEENAKKYIVNTIASKLNKIREFQEKIEKSKLQEIDPHKLPNFGQRRELQRIVDLCNAYVYEAEYRGIKDIKQNAVSKNIVERLYNPSNISIQDYEIPIKEEQNESLKDKKGEKIDEAAEKELKAKQTEVKNDYLKDTPNFNENHKIETIIKDSKKHLYNKIGCNPNAKQNDVLNAVKKYNKNSKDKDKKSVIKSYIALCKVRTMVSDLNNSKYAAKILQTIKQTSPANTLLKGILPFNDLPDDVKSI